MSAASGTSIRFAPGPFKYNGRVAAALVPSLLVAAGLGGRPVMGVFTIGTMLFYIMDAMQYREGAFTVVSCRQAEGRCGRSGLVGWRLQLRVQGGELLAVGGCS